MNSRTGQVYFTQVVLGCGWCPLAGGEQSPPEKRTQWELLGAAHSPGERKREEQSTPRYSRFELAHQTHYSLRES